MENKDLRFPHHIVERMTRLIALMDSTLLGNDSYYESRLVNLLIQWVGDDYLKKELESWSSLKKQIRRIDKDIRKVKPLYDLIEDKKFATMDYKNPEARDKTNKQIFIKQASKIPLFDNPMTFLYIWFVKRSPQLQQIHIKSEYYKIIEHTGYKTVGMDKSKASESKE